MEAKQILGLDVGKARSGIARASNIAKLAEPLMSVETSKLVACLRKLLTDYEVEAIAVGLPRNLKGEDTPQTAWVRKWLNGVKEDIKAPFFWQDEALTTKEAEIRKLASKNPVDVDAMAAGVILQDFLDSPEAERVLA